MTTTTRPVYLNLLTIKFPITAYASILHRISGIIVFLLIPFALAMLQNVLYLPEVFKSVHVSHQDSVLVLCTVWFGLSALFYHVLAGIRHMCMDLGFGEKLRVARASSYFVILVSIVMSILLGIYLC